MSLVHRGSTFGLDLPLEAFAVPPTGRRALELVDLSRGWCHHDDRVTLDCQASTHVDGLRHIRHPDYGFYNGASDESVSSGSLGVDTWSTRGIAGRCVLIDLPRFLAAAGKPQLDHARGEPFPASLLDEALRAQGTTREPGDIILLRTGWLDHYFNAISDDERASFPSHFCSSGLVQSRESVAWLWNARISAIFADNIALEAVPAVASSPFNRLIPPDSGLVTGQMHSELIPLLGLAVGELWWLEELAEDSAQDGVYEALLVAKPLHLHGAAGSPANAFAIK